MFGGISLERVEPFEMIASGSSWDSYFCNAFFVSVVTNELAPRAVCLVLVGIHHLTSEPNILT